MTEKTMSDFYDYMCLHFKDKSALIFEQTRYSFHDIERKGRKLANALTKMGLKRKDRIAVLMPNCPEVIFADYACSKTGIVTIPLAAYLKSDDIGYILEETEADALIYHEKFKDHIDTVRRTNPESLKQYICLSHQSVPADNTLDLNHLIDNGSDDHFSSVTEPDDYYLIIYSGGTTGKPKGIIHSHRTWVETIVITMMEMGVTRNEVFIAATPLTHGARAFMVPVLLMGGSCVIRQRFDAEEFLETVEQEGGTTTFMVPTMISSLLSTPDLEKYNTVSLKNIVYGAAPISPDLLKKAVQTFGQVFTQAYGQTESPVAISFLSREDHIIDGDEKAERRLRSCGRPSLLLDIKLVDSNGNEVPNGETGEMVVKSPNNMVSYLNKPDLTRETLKDGWIFTGDIAWRDDDGYIYIFDRKKDMIVSGGFNVYPTEIENTLQQHPAVRSAAVIGIPDEKWGEAVKAVVIPENWYSDLEEELIAHCKEKKGSIMAPKSIDFTDTIPLTPLGKIDKSEIRKKYWAGQERQVY